MPVLSDGFCADTIRKFSSSIPSHLSEKRQRLKEHRKSLGSFSPSLDLDGTFPSRLRRHGDPEKPKGKRQCKTKHLGPTGAQDAVAVNQWGVSWTKPCPPTQGKSRGTSRCDHRRSRCSFICTIERPYFVCGREASGALCFGSQPKRSPRAQRGTV